MTRMVYILGGLLVLVGAIALVTGAPIVRLEQGWTEVIAGSVAASAGCVILVLGAILARLEALQEALGGVPAGVTAQAVPLDASDERLTNRALPQLTPVVPVEPAPAVASAVEPELPLRFDDVSVERQHAEPELERTDEPGTDELPPAPAVQEPTPAEASPFVTTLASRVPNFMSHPLVRRIWQPQEAKPSAVESAPIEPSLMPLGSGSATPAMRSSVDLSSGWDREPEPEEPAAPALEPAAVEPDHHEPVRHEPAQHEPAHMAEIQPEAPAPHPYRSVVEQEEPEPHPELFHEPEPAPVADFVDREPPPPTVVGRYTAGSASYVMYSNGMIEVETETGVHQFASMQELKTFIEQQDKEKV